MTTKDLQKLITEEKESDLRRSNNTPEMERLMERVYGRPFYRWQGLPLHIQPTTRHVDKKVCCFNHAIGLPSKDGVIYSDIRDRYTMLLCILLRLIAILHQEGHHYNHHQTLGRYVGVFVIFLF
jgi:hypothetical protein